MFLPIRRSASPPESLHWAGRFPGHTAVTAWTSWSQWTVASCSRRTCCAMLPRRRFAISCGKMFATCNSGNHARREVFFGARPDLKGRDVLVLDAVMDSGVTQEFLLRRLGESQPRSLRLAVLLDKPSSRHVALEPDYFAFQTASNQMWVGYGLADAAGKRRNERGLSAGGRTPAGNRPLTGSKLLASNKSRAAIVKRIHKSNVVRDVGTSGERQS